MLPAPPTNWPPKVRLVEAMDTLRTDWLPPKVRPRSVVAVPPV